MRLFGSGYDAREDSANIRVEHRVSLSEREGCDCGRGVRAYTWERQQIVM
jgi:hypothetical protein